MSVKISLLMVALALLSVSAMAVTVNRANDFEVNDKGATDLLGETQALRLKSEETIPALDNRSSSFIGFGAGIMSLGSLHTNTNGNTVDYDLGKAFPLLTVTYQYFPDALNRPFGRFGIGGSLGYSYGEFHDQPLPTSLHLLPVSLDLVYRNQHERRQKWLWFTQAGAREWIWFQRGIDQLNNSAAVFGGHLGAGLAIKTRAVGWEFHRQDPEIYFLLERSISASNSTSSFNGTSFQIGGAFEL